MQFVQIHCCSLKQPFGPRTSLEMDPEPLPWVPNWSFGGFEGKNMKKPQLASLFQICSAFGGFCSMLPRLQRPLLKRRGQERLLKLQDGWVETTPLRHG